MRGVAIRSIVRRNTLGDRHAEDWVHGSVRATDVRRTTGSNHSVFSQRCNINVINRVIVLITFPLMSLRDWASDKGSAKFIGTSSSICEHL
ncbi:hypothetical protein KIN20_034870 [Parelaphostrongylus tenuis]|uniref:Uncharacterized protein n=1 Tax=Parelaphostrongylus tenuis TaxID=148309 RepID=A0AAD5RB28_PARTN|nr:hypothetical protein KIN20_034870 [Parelaphostrongylus tenuis]